MKQKNIQQIIVGYAKVSEGISIGAEYLMSWENNSLRLYLLGEIEYSSGVARYITEDAQYYICYTDYPNNDKGDRNFAYGICHRTSFTTYNHEDLYKSEGIAIDSGDYDSVGVSKLPVNIVNSVYMKAYNNRKNAILEAFTGIDIKEHELDALTAIKYQYGNIGNAVELYKETRWWARLCR